MEYAREIQVPGKNVGEALQFVSDQNPGLKNVLYDSTGNVRELHRIFLNDEIVERDAVDHAGRADDVVNVVTMIAGG